jgi:uncharacterized membrane protein YccF (DUF307 family)
MIRLILNILWFIWGGWLSGLLWGLAGVIMAITVIGLPWTPACFRIAGFCFWPFGKAIVDRPPGDLGTGAGGCLLNVVWFVLAGWYIALSHLIIAFTEAITIIGLPFASKDLQLAQLALAPVGKDVVRVD